MYKLLKHPELPKSISKVIKRLSIGKVSILMQMNKRIFQQPAQGIALNRISPLQGPSQIFGVLTATGRIILINQAGIYFGPTAHVDVGGLIASTSDIANADFLKGNYYFGQPSPYRGSIINEGSIQASQYGLVALMGTAVVNRGRIEAHMGSIQLASGNTFTIDLNGDGLIHFGVGEQATQRGLDQNGNELKNGVSNEGKLIANGGSVYLTGRAAQGVLDNVVNISGVVQAHSVYGKNGTIVLDAGTGNAHVSGRLIASGGKYSTGGTVKVLAKSINVDSSAKINVSGGVGGGTILIGGNQSGAGPEMNASRTYVSSGAILNADARLNGDGGKIIIWSDGATNFYGTASAQGGVFGGNGGFVETSGHYLDVNGSKVNTSAPYGNRGTWLLDPTDIYIASSLANATAAGMSGSDTSANSSGPLTYQAGAVNASLLLTATLDAALANNNILVTTTSGGGGTGNITVVDPILWASTEGLTLNATNKIFINNSISGVNGSLTLIAKSAALDSSSITTNSSGTISVKNFTLQTGGWNQVTSSLPSFNVSSNFQIGSGAPSATVQFIRATSGNGAGSPYIVTDIYGLQGIASNSTTLSENFTLGNNINAISTANWTNGFVPIGITGTPYTGTFNGAGYQVSSLLVNAVGAAGLFGATSAAANISLVGVTGSITGTTNVGGLVGTNAGTIANAYSFASVSGGTTQGGLVGNNSGTISTSYSIGSVASGGGLVGANTNTITNSYWNSDTTSSTNGLGTSLTTTQLHFSL